MIFIFNSEVFRICFLVETTKIIHASAWQIKKKLELKLKVNNLILC